nr:unnamed protein product [Digitaria exilis]
MSRLDAAAARPGFGPSSRQQAPLSILVSVCSVLFLLGKKITHTLARISHLTVFPAAAKITPPWMNHPSDTVSPPRTACSNSSSNAAGEPRSSNADARRVPVGVEADLLERKCAMHGRRGELHGHARRGSKRKPASLPCHNCSKLATARTLTTAHQRQNGGRQRASQPARSRTRTTHVAAVQFSPRSRTAGAGATEQGIVEKGSIGWGRDGYGLQEQASRDWGRTAGALPRWAPRAEPAVPAGGH